MLGELLGHLVAGRRGVVERHADLSQRVVVDELADVRGDRERIPEAVRRRSRACWASAGIFDVVGHAPARATRRIERIVT